MIDTIIFDLDGTLLNTLEDLTDSVNFALGELGYAARGVDEVRMFVGEGVKLLVNRALPEAAKERTDECLKIFERHYDKNKNNKTRAYDGVAQMLDDVKKAGYKTAIVSNKYHAAVTALQKLEFPQIDVAIGESAEMQKKPAADMVNKALSELGSSVSMAAYVGDSDIDVATARNSKLPIVAVSWGFRSRDLLVKLGADRIIDSPSELIDAIKSL